MIDKLGCWFEYRVALCDYGSDWRDFDKLLMYFGDTIELRYLGVVWLCCEKFIQLVVETMNLCLEVDDCILELFHDFFFEKVGD